MMYSSPASSSSSPDLSFSETPSTPDTPPANASSPFLPFPPSINTCSQRDLTRPKRDCRPFPPMTVLDQCTPTSPIDQRPYLSRRVSFPSLPPPPPRIDPYLLPSISSLMLASSPWDYSTQLQFALNNAQASTYLHPFGRGHQHYQSHLQPGGHIIPGVGAGLGRELEHHHPGEHGLAGLLGGNRKRPKYTRSKTGCLTCRTKKIKCDETKPMCTKCVHGQRECTWPKDVQVTPSGTSSAPSTRASTTIGTPQRSPSRPGQSSGLSRSNSANGRATSNFLSSSERGSSSAGTPSRETSPQERLPSHARNSTESRTPGLLIPHSGSSLSGLSNNDPLAFPQSLDMTSFGSSEVDSFPLSAQFGNLPVGYNDQLSMMNQSLSVDSPGSYSPWGSSNYGNGSPIDTSTASGQWSATSNQLLSNPDPIAPFFRTVQERNLVLVSPSSYY